MFHSYVATYNLGWSVVQNVSYGNLKVKTLECSSYSVMQETIAICMHAWATGLHVVGLQVKLIYT